MGLTLLGEKGKLGYLGTVMRRALHSRNRGSVQDRGNRPAQESEKATEEGRDLIGSSSRFSHGRLRMGPVIGESWILSEAELSDNWVSGLQPNAGTVTHQGRSV